MKIHGDYWEWNDGSCSDIRSGCDYNSVDAMYNARIWDSYSDLKELYDNGSSERNPINLTSEELNIYRNYYRTNTWKTEYHKKMIKQLEEKIYGDKARKIIFEGTAITGGNKINYWLYEDDYNNRKKAEDSINNFFDNLFSWFK